MRRDTEGNVLDTMQKAANDMLSFFAKSEVATITDFDQVRANYNHTGTTMPNHQPRDVHMTITHRELTAMIQRSQKRRAAGADGLTNDILQTAPTTAANHILPLLVKTQLMCREPSEWKGCMTASIWKGKGPQALAESYRSIALCSVILKFHHAYLRTKLLDLMTVLTRASQVGGLSGRGADFATHQVRSRIDISRARKHHCITIYVDLVAAFYRAVRELVLPLKTTDREQIDIVRGLEVPPLLQPALLQLMKEEPTLTKVIGNQHLLYQLA